MSEAIRSGGALVSGAISDRGSRDARHGAVRSRQDAGAALRRYTGNARNQLRSGYRATDALYRPYAELGIQGFQDAQANSDNFEFDPSTISNNPAYQFRMEQGLEALNRSFAAKGGLGSGNRLTGIMDYAQGLASTEYDNEYQRQYGRFSDNFNRNMGIAGYGMQATNARAANVGNFRNRSADLLSQLGQSVAGLYTDVGDINAASEMGRAQNWAGTNMYMADQAGQGFDRYVPISRMGGGGGSMGGGSKFSMGGG